MLRWGIVGFGDIARKAVAPAIQAHGRSELTAICRRDPAALAADAAMFDVPHAFVDFDAMLAASTLDAVYVATPVHLHAPHTLAAIQHGLHVLVEKPMALNGSEAEAMVSAASHADLTLGVAFYHRFYPINLRVAQMVRSGELGRLIALHGNASAALRLSADDPKRWRLRAAEGGGGPLMDAASHRIDLFHELAGPAEAVAAFTDRHVLGDADVEDTASLIIRYRSGVHATLSSCWSIDPARGDYEIWCTQGHVNVPYVRGSSFTVQRGGASQTVTMPPGELHDLPLIDAFVAAVEDGAALTLDGDRGLEVQRVIDAAYAAAASETVVRL